MRKSTAPGFRAILAYLIQHFNRALNDSEEQPKLSGRSLPSCISFLSEATLLVFLSLPAMQRWIVKHFFGNN